MIGLNWSSDPFVTKIYNYSLSLNTIPYYDLRNYLPNMFLYISVISNQEVVAIGTKLRFASLFFQTKVGSC